MIGTSTPIIASRSTIFGTALAASAVLTVTRTSSEPARHSSATCLTVDVMSAVSVLVIDCTTTGACPPTRTLPILTCRVMRRGAGPKRSDPAASRLPAFSFRLMPHSLVWRRADRREPHPPGTGHPHPQPAQHAGARPAGRRLSPDLGGRRTRQPVAAGLPAPVLHPEGRARAGPLRDV